MSGMSIPTKTGSVICVKLPSGERVNYIRGEQGAWYPIATGMHPYLSKTKLGELDFEAVGW